MTIPSSFSSQNSSSAAKGPVELRDFFAGHALAALIIAPRQPGVSRLEMPDMAKMAYEYADTMLKSR
jgi:hypothetical protein